MVVAGRAPGVSRRRAEPAGARRDRSSVVMGTSVQMVTVGPQRVTLRLRPGPGGARTLPTTPAEPSTTGRGRCPSGLWRPLCTRILRLAK
jgi:hypothetical protein